MQTARRVPYWASLALLAYMPFHIFLSQWLSTFTGGLSVWKLWKDAALLLVTVFAVCLVFWQRRGTKLFVALTALTAVYALLHVALWAAHPHIYRDSALLGVTYNVRVLCFSVLGLAAGLLYPGELPWRTALKVVLVVSTVVAALGVLQYFLPKDLLTHFGYSLQRGVRPAFFIDDRPNLPRIMSTLRDPNSLGAYLVLPMAVLAGLALRLRDVNRRLLVLGALSLQALAVFLTFSRSAWLAAVLAVVLVVWWEYRAWFLGIARRYWWLVLAAVLVVGAGVYAERHAYFVKSILSHSTGKPKAQYDSNGFHLELVEKGLRGIRATPLGHGPGTAGLASIQNPNGGQLTENYYVQIGFEVGVLGLALFLAYNALVYARLWQAKTSGKFALCAAFWAYVLTNMLLHTWSNEAVAAQWWIMAGLALSLPWGRAATHAGRQPGKPKQAK